MLFSADDEAGRTLTGHTDALEAGVAWSVGYSIEADAFWRTTHVHATCRTALGHRTTSLERRDGDRWYVDGEHRAHLDGCVDVDFESSSVTNTLPVHRLELPGGLPVSAPAAFVRAEDLRVERLEQTYTRLDDDGRFAYESSTFDFACELTYDRSGLLLDYPGIAIRVS